MALHQLYSVHRLQSATAKMEVRINEALEFRSQTEQLPSPKIWELSVPESFFCHKFKFQYSYDN